MLSCDWKTKERAVEISYPKGEWLEGVVSRLQKKARQGKNVFIKVEYNGIHKLYACELSGFDYKEALDLAYSKVTGYQSKEEYDNAKKSFAEKYGL